MRKYLIGLMVMGLGVMLGVPVASRYSKDVVATTVQQNQALKIPKYIFLFIGDGMGYPQIQSASYYLGASKGKLMPEGLSFTDFPVVGSATTYNATSFCPDSASTATSIATGYKTYSGIINMDTTMTIPYEAITEKLKSQKDYKVGVVTSVNLNHATPAAFYAHQSSRNNYYEIGLELIESNFDYFAGGAFKKETGAEENQVSLYDLAEEAGYTVARTQEEAAAIDAKSDRCIVVAEYLADSDAMSYALDKKEDEWSLADYVSKGIEVLDNNEGFFMMVEGGKVDWACHANDAGTSIQDVVALSDAVEEAVKFYNEHSDETLILVTADHETGGLTIGYAGTDYDTYLENLTRQKISYAKFDEVYVEQYKANHTPFEMVLEDIKTCFGLMTSNDPEASNSPKLVLTDYEYNKLEAAYEKTMADNEGELSQEEYVMYGSYEPLSVAITHILNNKSGINFASYAHTGLPVPVFAKGVNAEAFTGFYDNTDIYKKLAEMTQVK